MASDADFIFVTHQPEAVGATAREMFGEYGLYADGTFLGVVCDNKLFVKPTAGGRAFVGTPTEAPPYRREAHLPGWGGGEDRQWLCELVRRTVKGLPTRRRGGRSARLTARRTSVPARPRAGRRKGFGFLNNSA